LTEPGGKLIHINVDQVTSVRSDTQIPGAKSQLDLTSGKFQGVEENVDLVMQLITATAGPSAVQSGSRVLVTYRHGLRVSEVCGLEWHQVELEQGRMHVRRVKNGTPSVHPIRGDEIRALRKLRRESPTEAYVFVTERGGPMSTIGFHHLIQRLGKAARMPFPLHPHMLRHACGYKLANDGHDTRALQHYLGHKNIQHTVRYTELSPDRFRDFWRD
jgi:integrase